jgi:hypothetical protein
MAFWHSDPGIDHINKVLKRGHPEQMTLDDLSAARAGAQLPLARIVDLKLLREDSQPHPDSAGQSGTETARNLASVVFQAELQGIHLPKSTVQALRVNWEETGACPTVEEIGALALPVAPLSAAEISYLQPQPVA